MPSTCHRHLLKHLRNVSPSLSLVIFPKHSLFFCCFCWFLYNLINLPWPKEKISTKNFGFNYIFGLLIATALVSNPDSVLLTLSKLKKKERTNFASKTCALVLHSSISPRISKHACKWRAKNLKGRQKMEVSTKRRKMGGGQKKNNKNPSTRPHEILKKKNTHIMDRWIDGWMDGWTD